MSKPIEIVVFPRRVTGAELKTAVQELSTSKDTRFIVEVNFDDYYVMIGRSSKNPSMQLIVSPTIWRICQVHPDRTYRKVYVMGHGWGGTVTPTDCATLVAVRDFAQRLWNYFGDSSGSA